MLVYLLPRLLIGAFALLLLGLQSLESSQGGGHSGMSIKLGLFIALAVLLMEGLYLVGEILFLFYKGRYMLAVVDLVLLVWGVVVFLILAS